MLKYDFWDGVSFIKEVRKLRPCLSGLSQTCLKQFLTTRDNRICVYCTDVTYTLKPNQNKVDKKSQEHPFKKKALKLIKNKYGILT